jgi:putative DNA primase/helicase
MYIRGEEKYKPPFMFKNTARLTFSANDLPKGNIDYAFSRRLILINFPNSFEKNKDTDLIKKLSTEVELSGLLNLALAGLRRLQENGGFSNSKLVEETQREYLINSDSFNMFLNECTSPSEENTDKDDTYFAYLEWCFNNNIEPLKENTFCKQMSQNGIKTYRRNGWDEKTKHYVKIPEFVGIELNKKGTLGADNW